MRRIDVVPGNRVQRALHTAGDGRMQAAQHLLGCLANTHVIDEALRGQAESGGLDTVADTLRVIGR